MMHKNEIYEMCKKAFEENKVKELLKGDEGYACTPGKSVPANIPTDWAVLFKEGIYKLREDYSDDELKTILKSELLSLLSKDAIEVWIAFRIFFTQLYFEKNNYTDFRLIDDEILNATRKSLANNEIILKNCNVWQGLNCEEGLWNDVVGSNNAMFQLFGVSLL